VYTVEPPYVDPLYSGHFDTNTILSPTELILQPYSNHEQDSKVVCLLFCADERRRLQTLPQLTGQESTLSLWTLPQLTGQESTLSLPQLTGQESTLSLWTLPQLTGQESTLSLPQLTGTLSLWTRPQVTG
jgi:hypothetical protein